MRVYIRTNNSWKEITIDKKDNIALTTTIDDMENPLDMVATVSYSIKAVRNRNNEMLFSNFSKIDAFNVPERSYDCMLMNNNNEILHRGELLFQSVDKYSYNFTFTGNYSLFFGRLSKCGYGAKFEDDFRFTDWLTMDEKASKRNIYLTKDIVYKSFTLINPRDFGEAWNAYKTGELQTNYGSVDGKTINVSGTLLANNKQELFATTLIGFAPTNKEHYDDFETSKWITRPLCRWNYDILEYNIGDELMSFSNIKCTDDTFAYSDTYRAIDNTIDSQYGWYPHVGDNKALTIPRIYDIPRSTDLVNLFDEHEQYSGFNKWDGSSQYVNSGSYDGEIYELREQQQTEYRSYYQMPYLYVGQLLRSLNTAIDNEHESDIKRITGYDLEIDNNVIGYLDNLVMTLPRMYNNVTETTSKENTPTIKLADEFAYANHLTSVDWNVVNATNDNLQTNYSNIGLEMTGSAITLDSEGQPATRFKFETAVVNVDDGQTISFDLAWGISVKPENRSTYPYNPLTTWVWNPAQYILTDTWVEDANGVKQCQDKHKVAFLPKMYVLDAEGNYVDAMNYSEEYSSDKRYRANYAREYVENMGYNIIELPIYQSSTGRWPETVTISDGNIESNRLKYVYNPIICKRVGGSNNVKFCGEVYLFNIYSPVIAYNTTGRVPQTSPIPIYVELKFLPGSFVHMERKECGRSGQILNMERLTSGISVYEILMKITKMFNLIWVFDELNGKVHLTLKNRYVNERLNIVTEIRDVDVNSIVKKFNDRITFSYEMSNIDEIKERGYDDYGNLKKHGATNALRDVEIPNSAIVSDRMLKAGFITDKGLNDGMIDYKIVRPTIINSDSYGNFYYRNTFNGYETCCLNPVCGHGMIINRNVYPILTDDYETELNNDMYCWHSSICTKIDEIPSDRKYAVRTRLDYYMRISNVAVGYGGDDVIKYPYWRFGGINDTTNHKIEPAGAKEGFPKHYYGTDLSLYGNYTTMYGEQCVGPDKLWLNAFPSFTVINKSNGFVLYYDKPTNKFNNYEDWNNLQTLQQVNGLEEYVNDVYGNDYEVIECNAVIDEPTYIRIRNDWNAKSFRLHYMDVDYMLLSISSIKLDETVKGVNCKLRMKRIRETAINNIATN